MHMGPVAQMLFLLLVANGTPVCANDVLGRRLSCPLDGSVRLGDGQPLFGASKTVRGLALSLIATALCAPVVWLEPGLGLLAGGAAMGGDLFSSFFKRRLRLPPSARATGLDQIPESLFPALACRGALSLTAADIALICGLFFLGEILFSRVLFKVHLRDHPY